MKTFTLSTLEDTADFAHALAEMLRAAPSLRVLLLYGPLGSGKTTLVGGLVRALPNGDLAEISSPSFTVCNHYPTMPPVLHCDLYRSGNALPDEMLDALDDDATITIVEWAEHMPPDVLPEDFLDIRLQACHEKRLVTVEPHGSSACAALERLAEDALGNTSAGTGAFPWANGRTKP